MVPTTGLEPINRVFSPLPTLASFSVFIAHKVTSTINLFKHYVCIFGKSWEEKRVQIVCKETGCANFVQTKLAPESVQTCAKILACRGVWLACGAFRPSPRGQAPIAIALRLSAALVTQQRGLDARPVKKYATANFDVRNFSSRTPRKNSPARNRQPRQQLFLVNEASLTRRRLFWFAIHGGIFPHFRSRSARFPNKINFALFHPE